MIQDLHAGTGLNVIDYVAQTLGVGAAHVEVYFKGDGAHDLGGEGRLKGRVVGFPYATDEPLENALNVLRALRMRNALDKKRQFEHLILNETQHRPHERFPEV